MSVLIRTLGQDQVVVGGQAVHWPSRAARTLFYLLLVHPRGLTKTEIIELLWGDSLTTESNSNFKVTHFRVRQALGDQKATREDGGRYVLSPEYYQNADHVQFQAELEQAKTAHGREERLRHLYRALEVYGGDFLPDHLTDWTEETRNTLRAASVRARLEVAQTHCSATECHAAVRSLAGALATDPLVGERYHQDLMTCLCTLHKTDEAVSHYRHFLTFIQREIGDTPTQETVRLADQIRAGQPHLSRHIGAQTPCPRRALYGDTYIDDAPQPGLDAALLEQALERGGRMLGLLRQLSTVHDWPALAETLRAQLSVWLETPYTGLAGPHRTEPQDSHWPSEVTEAVQAALDQVRSGRTGTDDEGDANVHVMVLAARTTDRPPFWLWAAWEQGQPVPGAAPDLLQGAVDIMESVLSQPHWTRLNVSTQ